MPGGGLIIPGTYRRGWKVEDLPTSSEPITQLTEEEADLLLGRVRRDMEGVEAERPGILSDKLLYLLNS